MAAYTPRSLEFADTAPLRIEGEAVGDVAPEAVWAVLVDHARWPEWFGGPLVRCEATSTDPATGVGSTRRVVLRPNINFDEEFIAWEPSSLWAFTVTDGPPGFRSVVERCTIHVEGPGRTRVTYRMAIDPTGFVKPMAPLLKRGITKSLNAAMANLVERARTSSGSAAGSAD